jgi:hypothetical protein
MERTARIAALVTALAAAQNAQPRGIPSAVEPQSLPQLQLLCLALLRAVLLFSSPLLSGRLSRRSSLPVYELGLLVILVFASRIGAALVVRAP